MTTVLFTFVVYGNAVAGTGAATEYKINIYKIKLCDSTSTASSCNNSVTIYDGDSGAIDIANTTAGAAAANLGNASAAKFGTSYTYMEITMGRAFTVKGSAEDDAGNTCYTKSGQAGSAGTLSKGSNDSDDLASTTLYAAMVGTSVGDNLTGLSSLTDTSGTAGTIESDDEYTVCAGVTVNRMHPSRAFRQHTPAAAGHRVVSPAQLRVLPLVSFADLAD